MVGFLLISSTLLFSACSNDKEAATDSTSTKQETVNSSSKEKAAAEKKKAEEAEKKKQEEISKKVIEADTAMKAAESNPTDETIATAKSAIEAIPGGNSDLSKRLETATANLNTIKQQSVSTQVQQQTEQTPTNSSNTMSDAEWQAELARRKEIARQDEINAQAEFQKRIEEAAANAPKPTIETDENGRTYIFENHDAYKNEPYYTEDWKNNPSPYQDQ